jgi:hypothetical protein
VVVAFCAAGTGAAIEAAESNNGSEAATPRTRNRPVMTALEILG